MRQNKSNFFVILSVLLGMSIANAIERPEPIIIDHNCAFLEPIPVSAILQARDSLHIAYGHTSHGSQLMTGMTALAQQDTSLVGYKGDYYCWGDYADFDPHDCIDIDDNFRPGDLGHYGDTQWADETRYYLEEMPRSADINVIIWSWCGGCSDNTEEGIQAYLDAMDQLEQDYPDIHFVYMTGHRDIWADETLKRNNQQIRDYCLANNKVLYDFADIESYDPDNVYFEYCDDNCDYYDENLNYQGNWADEWQNSHVEGVDWYDCYAAHSRALNGNRKAYAAWWLWCRLAGWPGPDGLAAPEVVISISGDQVVLSWEPVAGAEAYQVYSSDSAYSGFTPDESGTFNECTWTASLPGEKRFYRVTALAQ
jgi:hypothetical protein